MVHHPLLRSAGALLLLPLCPVDAFSAGAVSSNRLRGAPVSMSPTQDTAEASAATYERIDRISSPALLDNYDTFLLDMWGVMHDGSQPYEGVLQTIQELKKAGKRMIVLSNSSKRRENSERMLVKLGFNVGDFENIITSGDVSHSLLQNNAHSLGCQNWDVISNLIEQKKQNVFVFGSGDEDEHYCTSAGWTLTSVEEADLIVARGTFTINDGTTTIHKKDDEMEYWEVMESSMFSAAQRKLPMIVANPDKVRPDEGLPPMPGAIGDTYERFVWTTHCAPVGNMTEEKAREYVKRVGKPFREVYDIALGEGERERAIMIGDALETDVVGGDAAGVPVLWVINDGIHGKDVGDKGADGVLGEFNRNAYGTYAYGKKVTPRYVADHFRW